MPRESLSLALVDIQYLGFAPSSPFFRIFGRMVDLPCPGEVGNVHQAVNALVETDEGSELRKVPDASR